MLDVTIIGAGITGTYLSSLLRSQGLEVLIIDKSKSIGGRFCTKPVGGDLADYGCQLIKPKCDLAKKVVQDFSDSQLVIPNMIKSLQDSFISVYGLSRIPKYLSLGVPCLTNTKIKDFTQQNNFWNIKLNNYSFKSKILILTMPPNQVRELLTHNNFTKAFKTPDTTYESFFTITFTSDSIFQFSNTNTDKSFKWLINNKRKGLLNNRNVYTVNTSDKLTQKLHSVSPGERYTLIREKLENYGFMNIENQREHFWKYAFVSNTKSKMDFSWNSSKGIGACGDSYGRHNFDGCITSAKLVYDQIITYLN